MVTRRYAGYTGSITNPNKKCNMSNTQHESLVDSDKKHAIELKYPFLLFATNHPL